MQTTFSFPTTILFGPGVLPQLPRQLSAAGVHRPLVVTDRGLRQAPVFAAVYRLLEGAPVFEGVDPNPTEQNVLDGVAAYRQENCDGIVAVGGGSPLDAAKAIRLKVTHALPLAEYDYLKDGARRILPNLPPCLGVPTTAGTGSDVSRSAVITIAPPPEASRQAGSGSASSEHSGAARKTVIFSPYLIPTVSLSDPELTLAMPPRITAGTGMDAFTHNLEAYLARGYHPMCDAIALEGLRLVWLNLPVVMRHGADLEARTQMMMAAIMGAVAFQKGLGATHSLALPLGAIAGMHHGTANAVMLPHVLEFNKSAAAGQLATIGVVLDACGVGAAIERVRELSRICGLAPRLRDYGVTEAMLPQLAGQAIEDGCHLTNPRPCTRGDMLALYKQAL